MQNDDWDFGRASATISLAELDIREAIPLIMDEIKKSDDIFLRRDMLRSLLKFKDRQTIPLLIFLVENEDDWEIRKSSVNILGYLGTAEVVEVLVKILKTDKHVYVRQEAEKSLQIISNDNKIAWTSPEALLARKHEIT